MTMVPLCTGVPLDSVTIARTVAWAFSGSTPRSIEIEIVDPVGDVSGTLSHAIATAIATNATIHRRMIMERFTMIDPWLAESACARRSCGHRNLHTIAALRC